MHGLKVIFSIETEYGFCGMVCLSLKPWSLTAFLKGILDSKGAPPSTALLAHLHEFLSTTKKITHTPS